MLSLVLYLLYVAIIGVCVVMARLSRDRPSLQLLCMPLVQLALYALVHRAWSDTGHDATVFLDNRPLAAFWAVLLLWPCWSLYVVWRQRRGESFVGLDGQRWCVVTTQTAGGPVRVPRPLHLVRRDERRAAAGD